MDLTSAYFWKQFGAALAVVFGALAVFGETKKKTINGGRLTRMGWVALVGVFAAGATTLIAQRIEHIQALAGRPLPAVESFVEVVYPADSGALAPYVARVAREARLYSAGAEGVFNGAEHDVRFDSTGAPERVWVWTPGSHFWPRPTEEASELVPENTGYRAYVFNGAPTSLADTSKRLEVLAFTDVRGLKPGRMADRNVGSVQLEIQVGRRPHAIVLSIASVAHVQSFTSSESVVQEMIGNYWFMAGVTDRIRNGRVSQWLVKLSQPTARVIEFCASRVTQAAVSRLPNDSNRAYLRTGFGYTPTSADMQTRTDTTCRVAR